MTPLLTWLSSIVAAIMLFLHGLAAFSEEIARLGGERLRLALRRLTSSDWRAALMGTLTTALVQSSSAITSMAVGLAHNRTLSDRAAFGIMIGANVGTTLTAWLVAMKIAGLGPPTTSSPRAPCSSASACRIAASPWRWPWPPSAPPC